MEEANSVFTQYVDVGKITDFNTKVNSLTANQSSSPIRMPSSSEEELRQLLNLRDRKPLKLFLRSNHWPVDHPLRKTLWPLLCSNLHKTHSSIYEEMKEQLFGNETKNHVPVSVLGDHKISTPYFLNNLGLEEVEKILGIISHTNPDISYCPVLQCLVSVLLHYMEPSDCFNTVYNLFRSKAQFYLPMNKSSHNAIKLVMRDLSKKYARSAHSYIQRHSKSTETVFHDWLWWIFRDLPFHFLVKVIDCYLLEGYKVFYRVSIVLLTLFSKQSGKQPLSANHTIQQAVQHSIENLSIRVDKFSKLIFGIRGLNRREIRKFLVKNEMLVKSRAKALNTSLSSWSLGAEPQDGASTSKNFMGTVIQSPSSSVLSLDNAHKRRSMSVGMVTLPTINCHSIPQADFYVIWSWLPARSAVCQPKLLYTSEEHGVSLRTLYVMTEEYEPTIIVIKTLTDEIFGAFCSSSWSNRKQSSKNISYFGTGETFLFTLKPEQKKFPWIGYSRPDISRNAASMFMAGDSSVLIIGGGGGTAIMLDENLLRCRTEETETFGNPPLCSSKDFECKVVEIFGFE
ncbi:GTPase-activating protein skywalker-like isoform X2 [Octopus sinensis]|uniref:GTPase-activating protein skywalker-like isoform X2 n=1 Tax=Octopus sinensis TaxID=2607531 RepID=A0A7E6F4X1_9MOLL|nr:GTPase-activating protein skywalker-like isoform X2 [Octopus sinensis]